MNRTTEKEKCLDIYREHFPDIHLYDGVNGFVVKQQDGKDLIEKIERFLGLSIEERRKMGEAGREKVEREFDRNIVIQKYKEEVSFVRKKHAKNGK